MSSIDRYVKETPFVPKDPIVLGKMPDGSPIWMEPKDFIPTPDEELERVSNTLACRESQLVHKMAQSVMENAGRFIEQTFLKTASTLGVNAYFNDQRKGFEWAVRAGYESIQDGLTTVVKLKGRVVRTMTATIDPRLSDLVTKRVMQMVKELPSK